MTNDEIEPNRTHPAITQEALAHLGDGQIAYVKPIRSEDVSASTEDCARHSAFCFARRRRHADFAHRYAGSRAGKCVEPGIGSRERALKFEAKPRHRHARPGAGHARL